MITEAPQRIRHQRTGEPKDSLTLFSDRTEWLRWWVSLAGSGLAPDGSQ